MPKRLKRIINKDHLKKLPLPRRKKPIIPDAAVPHITNETIAEHREEVLAGARKYIYPLQHSKHKIVVISTALFIATVITFFTYSILALYKFQSTSTFTYRITQVIPFPVARANGRFVSYESYLFQLRHYIHYYEKQQKFSLKTDNGKQQLDEFKKKALDIVVSDAYIKQLASQKNVSVSNKDIEQQIAVMRSQNKLGSSEEVFEDVLRDFWGWSVNDFRRSLRQQILALKVASTLDTEAHQKATDARNEVANGAPFADVAKRYSADASTKDAGGEYPFAIDRSNRDLPFQTIEALFKLKPGDISPVVDTGYSLEIVRLNGYEGDSPQSGKVRASHIQVPIKDISAYVNPLKEQHRARMFIKL